MSFYQVPSQRQTYRGVSHAINSSSYESSSAWGAPRSEQHPATATAPRISSLSAFRTVASSYQSLDQVSHPPDTGRSALSGNGFQDTSGYSQVPSYHEPVSKMPKQDSDARDLNGNGYRNDWKHSADSGWLQPGPSLHPAHQFSSPHPPHSNHGGTYSQKESKSYKPKSQFESLRRHQSSHSYSNHGGSQAYSSGTRWQSNRNNSSASFGSNWRKSSSSTTEKTNFTSSNESALKAPDFDKLDLPDVRKDFYRENDHLADRSSSEIDDFLDDNQIVLSGRYQPRPCISFEDIDLPPEIMKIMREKQFEKPTPIQAQTWPIALSGDDMVGVAKTGSGKTCAFLIPGLVHLLNNRDLKRESNNPLMLVLCPTRELSQQVTQVAEEFTNALGLNSVCLYGGAPRYEQSKLLSSKQPQLVVATPGRLIDFMETKQVDVKLVSYLVLDEADRMLDMGFEPQIRTIIDNIRPERQTLMFSATWPDTVWQLAEDFLDTYTKINIGSQKLSANNQITQIVECCEEEEKPTKILDLLKTLVEKDKTLRTIIFCDTKKAVDNLHANLIENHFKAACIHGKKKQCDRESVLKQFAEDKVPILIATDVAARGLDISGIKHVINYDYPASSEDYVHRIGRTARRDATGTAYTFFTQNNMGQSGKLISILEEADQEVPTMLKFYASFVKQR